MINFIIIKNNYIIGSCSLKLFALSKTFSIANGSINERAKHTFYS